MSVHIVNQFISADRWNLCIPSVQNEIVEQCLHVVEIVHRSVSTRAKMNIFLIFLLSAVITMPLLSNTAIISEKLDLIIAVSDARNCSYITLSESDITMKSQTMYNITATARCVCVR